LKEESIYSRSFHSDNLTASKLSSLKAQGEALLAIRNELSVLVNSDILYYLPMHKNAFQKSVLPFIKERVHSNFTHQLCADVIKSYQNRFEAIQRRMIFEQVVSLEMTYYKKRTKLHKKGDPKGIVRKTESTPLTKVLSFLARSGNEGTLDYVRGALQAELKKPKKVFYQSVLDYSQRFGLARLLRLAMAKRTAVLAKYKDPVKFESLTFRGRSRLTKDIVSYNPNFGSVIKAFACFGWTERGVSIKIPVKYSKSFHGDMKKYTNGTDTSYTVYFSPNEKSVRVILSHEDLREFPDASPSDTYVGFDANSKHNQLVGSNGLTVDHNRKVLGDLVQELLHTDELKSKDESYKPGKKKSRKIDTMRRKVLHHTQRNCVTLCKAMLSRGENHAVFENLANGFGKTKVTTPEDFNYNRLLKEMHLSSIKDEFEHIARKRNISVSTVHPEYTSQQCSVCGFIDEGNRRTQEEFECLECGHKENADSNSSKNIGRRVSEAVQRDLLLEASKIGNGSYSPKVLPRWKVKEMLLSLRYNPPPWGDREAISCL